MRISTQDGRKEVTSRVATVSSEFNATAYDANSPIHVIDRGVLTTGICRVKYLLTICERGDKKSSKGSDYCKNLYM